jgi:glycosyltransferase involved in cell wall biosynthesis
MRVVHFVEALKGGPASYLNALLPLQVEAYRHVAVLCPGSQAHFVRVPGAEIIPFPDTGRDIAGVMALARLWRCHVSANRYDIAHLHSSFAGLAGRLAIRRRPAMPQIVYCAHGWAFGMETSGAWKMLYRLAERRLARRTDAIVNISDSESALAVEAGIPRNVSHLIHNGIADAVWSPLPEKGGPTRLLFVGRHDRQKGLDVLLDAMEVLRPLGFTLTVIGGPVIGAVGPHHLPPDVTDLGWQCPEVVEAAMAEADIVVIPSRWEGFGLVAAEAMRAGRPVVASAVGALPELVVDGATGVLCPPNSPLALAGAIEKLATKDLRAMGQRARERYEAHYTAARMHLAIDALYHRLVSARQ